MEPFKQRASVPQQSFLGGTVIPYVRFFVSVSLALSREEDLGPVSEHLHAPPCTAFPKCPEQCMQQVANLPPQWGYELGDVPPWVSCDPSLWSRGVQPVACRLHAAQGGYEGTQHKIVNLLKTFFFFFAHRFSLFVYLMCGPRQLFSSVA